MNWKVLRPFPWLDTRAYFFAKITQGGRLLDLGSSDGETLSHIAELRPDLKLSSSDKAGRPEHYPSGCDFKPADFERDKLPWPDGSMDAISCMHVVEHLDEIGHLVAEVSRLLKPGGRVYFETPHPKTTAFPSLAGRTTVTFTLNFYDDPTHVRPVPTERLGHLAREAGLLVTSSGISRNWLFAASYPMLLLLPPSRRKFTARVHWLGWSSYLVAMKPA